MIKLFKYSPPKVVGPVLNEDYYRVGRLYIGYITRDWRGLGLTVLDGQGDFEWTRYNKNNIHDFEEVK
jgi:hypothetical protein